MAGHAPHGSAAGGSAAREQGRAMIAGGQLRGNPGVQRDGQGDSDRALESEGNLGARPLAAEANGSNG
jgi:hypothetical protein